MLPLQGVKLEESYRKVGSLFLLKASGRGGETGGDWSTEEDLSKQLSLPMFNFVNYLVFFYLSSINT